MSVEKEVNGIEQTVELYEDLEYQLNTLKGHNFKFQDIMQLMIHSELATISEKLDDLYNK